jgi:hypothetical protein
MGLILVLTFLLLLIGPILFADYPIPDAKHYEALVEFFRGQGAFSDAGTIWRGRVLVPLLASILPFDAILSLRIVSIIFTLLCVIAYWQILSLYNFRSKERYLGIMLFVISVPTIVIGSTPLTDPAGMFFILLSLYIYNKFEGDQKRFLIIGVIIGVGVFARESVLFILPVFIVWEIVDSGIKLKVLKDLIIKTILIGIIPLISFIIVRLIVPKTYLFHLFSLSRLWENFITETFEATTLATIGQLSVILMIGLFGNYSEIMGKSKNVWKFILGAAVFLPELLYAYMIAPGNRFFWIYFVFGIPFLLYSLSNLGVKEK